MVDAQLERVQAPMDDNSHVDFEAMIQDIDQLDEILAGIEYANHTHRQDNNMAGYDARHGRCTT